MSLSFVTLPISCSLQWSSLDLGTGVLFFVYMKYQKTVKKSGGPSESKYCLSGADLIYRIRSSLKEMVMAVDLFGGFLSFLLQRKLMTGCNLISSGQLVAFFHSTVRLLL